MLQPSKTKFRKSHKLFPNESCSAGVELAFGDFALKVTEKGRLTSRQLEAGRRVISRITKRGGKMWMRVFPDIPVTRKPLEVRMGSGKGSVEYYVANLSPGKIIFELAGVSEKIAHEAITQAGYKLPVSSIFVRRR